MAVYIDSMNRRYGRMIMCHMLADTSEELHSMAMKIGLQRKWCQYEGSYKEHYDVSLGYKKKALSFGAIEISRKELGKLLAKKKAL